MEGASGVAEGHRTMTPSNTPLEALYRPTAQRVRANPCPRPWCNGSLRLCDTLAVVGDAPLLGRAWVCSACSREFGEVAMERIPSKAAPLEGPLPEELEQLAKLEGRRRGDAEIAAYHAVWGTWATALHFRIKWREITRAVQRHRALEATR